MAMVAAGRDFFHTFIASSVRRRYRRPAIYLVDTWIVRALGLFMAGGRIAMPVSSGPRSPDHTDPVEGLGPLLGLFDRLQDVKGQLAGARLLGVGRTVADLDGFCLKLATDPSVLDEIRRNAGDVGELIERASGSLQRDMFVRPYVDPTFVADTREALRQLVTAAERVAVAKPPLIPGLGFDRVRNSGVLFGSIPELDIEGPAILLAPGAIREWSPVFDGLRGLVDQANPVACENWFGTPQREHRIFAIALANVLFHEMTHAMVALPTDAIDDEWRLLHERWAMYRDRPGFEEGLANATAAVASEVTILKVMFDIRGRDIPKLFEGRYAKPWQEVHHWIQRGHQDYHKDETEVFLRAWDKNKRDFKAFAGVVGMYATNFVDLDWAAIYKDLEGGRIGTTGSLGQRRRQ
ncbi:MAG: hypothetical protein H6736_21950 [Alphaproteobacteria bacterium]|nr:hypothetical protein [Alphaproteobacteria bacterium]